MSKRRFYVTTAIPYVNKDPHLGFALECVQADVLARHRRLLLRGAVLHGLRGVLSPGELADGLCPEHGWPPERAAERNWFFRLSCYSDRLLELIESGRLVSSHNSGETRRSR